jgi:hypothetical protein
VSAQSIAASSGAIVPATVRSSPGREKKPSVTSVVVPSPMASVETPRKVAVTAGPSTGSAARAGQASIDGRSWRRHAR